MVHPHTQAHHGHLGGLLPGPDQQLADGGLRHARALLRIVQLVLHLPDARHVAAHLLLLVDSSSTAHIRSINNT